MFLKYAASIFTFPPTVGGTLAFRICQYLDTSILSYSLSCTTVTQLQSMVEPSSCFAVTVQRISLLQMLYPFPPIVSCVVVCNFCFSSYKMSQTFFEGGFFRHDEARKKKGLRDVFLAVVPCFIKVNK